MHNKPVRILMAACTLMIIAACGDGEHSQAAPERAEADSSGSDVVASSTVTTPSGKPAVKSAAGKISATSIGKRSAPISFRYEIEGKPIVGQPVTVKIFDDGSQSEVPLDQLMNHLSHYR